MIGKKFQFPDGYVGWKFNGIEVGKGITIEWEGAFWGTYEHKYYLVFELKYSNGDIFFSLNPQHSDFFNFIKDLNGNYCVYNWAYPSNIQIGEDAKLTFTWDGQNLKFYANGLLVISGSASSSCDLSGVKSLYLDSGADSYDFSYHKNLRIYNRVLTDDEIKQNVTNWQNPIREGLIFWVDANDISWGVWKDRIQGISGSWIGKDKINGYGVVRNFDSDIEKKGLRGVIGNTYYDISEVQSDEYTIGYKLRFLNLGAEEWTYTYPLYLYFEDSSGNKLYRIGIEFPKTFIGSSYISIYINDLADSKNLYADWKWWYNYYGWNTPYILQMRVNNSNEEVDVWLNGAKLSSGNMSGNINFTNVKKLHLFSQFESGWVESVRVYKRWLSDDELRKNLDWENGVVDDSLIAWYDFDADRVENWENVENGVGSVLSARFGKDMDINRWGSIPHQQARYISRIGVIEE